MYQQRLLTTVDLEMTEDGFVARRVQSSFFSHNSDCNWPRGGLRAGARRQQIEPLLSHSRRSSVVFNAHSYRLYVLQSGINSINSTALVCTRPNQGKFGSKLTPLDSFFFCGKHPKGADS